MSLYAIFWVMHMEMQLFESKEEYIVEEKEARVWSLPKRGEKCKKKKLYIYGCGEWLLVVKSILSCTFSELE